MGNNIVCKRHFLICSYAVCQGCRNWEKSYKEAHLGLTSSISIPLCIRPLQGAQDGLCLKAEAGWARGQALPSVGFNLEHFNLVSA